MIERQYHNPDKIYVQVEATFYPDGRIEPKSFLWDDGRHFDIERVTDVRRAASLKAGGIGMRYTCKVLGRTAYLYREEDKWFMERRT